MSPRQAWQRLPREARDTLFVLGVIAWTIAPHLGHLPLWCGALAAVVLLWRGRLALRGAPLPPRWQVGLVLAVAVALTGWSERTLLGREAGVILLVMLMALKTLELRARRDALVVFFLGFFLVLTNFLYSQSLAVALSMLVSVWGLLTALVLAHMPVGRPSLKRAGALAARAALLGLPLMVLLFVLFPRLAPLWGVPQDAAGRTGLSGTLQMGGVAQVANDDSIAMRVRFLGPVPAAEDMYFRGPVLSRFDGREWTRGPTAFGAWPRRRGELLVFGAGTDYELTIEPSRLSLLPLLELTPDRADAAPEIEGYHPLLRPDAQWQLDRPVTERLRLQARAFVQHRLGPLDALPNAADDLGLPAGYNPRSLLWARALRDQPRNAGTDARDLAEQLLAHVRANDYSYTLEPGSYGRDAVDEFWFDRRLGFCEHFAAAFVVMMRAMDVPARIVTGYQGSDPVPVDGYYVVRQSHAHAWAEFWQRGLGLGARGPHRRGGARAHPRQPQPAAAAGAGGAGAERRRPRDGAAPAPGLGGVEQPLEPVGAELLARRAAQPAEEAGLRGAGLGRPELAADRRAVRRQHRRRAVGAVGPPSPGPLAAPAAARGQGAGGLGRRRRRARPAAPARRARAPGAGGARRGAGGAAR
ncbi:MAG: DUF3488 and transglutaminase-like domain-containing protein [Rubrivivax sp.]